MAIDRQNIKDKFRSEENLPEELSWDNMEQGIQEKMNAGKSGKTSGFLSLTVIALALLMTIGIVYVLNDANKLVANNEKREDNVDSSSPDLSQNHTIDDTKQKKNENQTISHTEVSKIEKKYSLNNPNGSTELTVTREIKTKRTFYNEQSLNDTYTKNDQIAGKYDIPVKANEKSMEYMPDSKATSSDNKYNSPYTDNVKDDLFTDKINNNIDAFSNPTQKSDFNLDNLSNTIVENKESMITISHIGTKLFTIINQKSLELPYLDIINSPIVKNKEISSFKNYFSITGGLWNAGSKYDNTTLGTIKSKYEKDALSYGIGIGYSRMLSNKLCLDAGLEWNSFRTILDYNETTSYSEERENLLLSMDINTITGDTITEYGTGTVTGKQTRTVIHYNTQRVLSIPVLLSYMIQNKKFHYTFGLGPVMHYNLSAEGRTLVGTDQFLVYDKTYFNTLNYGLLAKLGVKYTLGERYLIGLDLSYSAPLGKWNTDSSFSLKRSMPGSHLSIAYRF